MVTCRTALYLRSGGCDERLTCGYQVVLIGLRGEINAMTAQRLQLTWYNKDQALIPTEAGKYGYTWVDPSDPRYCETHTLVMDEFVRGGVTPKNDQFQYSERADLDPQDDNLLILGESGDVLEALTRVPELAAKYVGKVKLVYIDPPFNTAQTFASYEDNLEHSIWLTMMRDRLLHLKKLLADDGSIWVHLDDVEVHRMRVLMDEVFGAENFVAEVAWQKADSARADSQLFSKSIDVILCYRKSERFTPVQIDANFDTSHYNLTDENGRYFRYLTLMKTGSNSSRSDRPTMFYPMFSPSGDPVFPIRSDGAEGCWRWDRKRAEQSSNLIYWLDKGRGLMPYLRSYKPDELIAPPQTLWLHSEVGANRTAKAELKALFKVMDPFSTPKPERLLERIIHIGSNPGDIVLDVFAGSGTTAAVAQKMGRRWVTCELRQDTFETFTRPRLEKVVNDQDPGGITRTKGERVAADGVELPEGVSADDAAAFASMLNKLTKEDPELKNNATVKALKAASKTRRTKEVINWRGGGGFQVAHLSPACFDYDPELDRVLLTPAATGQVLIESVAANLGFTLLHPDDDYVFDARRGKALLKVYEGLATEQVVDSLVSHVSHGETIVLAATGVADGVREYLRRALKGSRVVALPDDLFSYSRREQ